MKHVEYQVMREIEDDFWWYAGMRSAVAAQIDRHILGGVPARSSIPLRILDAGSGTGKNLDFLSTYGPTYGVEFATEAIRLGKNRGQLNQTQGSVSALPFRDGVFDLLTSFEVIYHRGVPDDVEAMREFVRVVRPGGHILVRLPAYDWLRGSHDLAVHTRHRYTLTEVRTLFKKVGLHVVHSTYLNSSLFPIAASKRALEAIRPTSGESDLKPVAKPLNDLFRTAVALEGAAASRISLPFGLTVLALGRRP